MIKRILFFGIVLTLVVLTTFNSLKLEGDSAKEKGIIHATLEVLPFDSAVKEADLIAEVTILESIGERNEPAPKTTFKVLIDEVLKGDSGLNNETVRVDQHGNSEWNFNDNALFQPSEKYILFLNKTVGIDESDFWIQGEESGMYKEIGDNAIVKIAYPDEELDSLLSTENSRSNLSGLSDIKENTQVLVKELLVEEIVVRSK